MKLCAVLVVVVFPCLALNGCIGGMTSEEPRVAKIEQSKLVIAELPDVLLVRRVILENTVTEITTGGKSRPVDEVRSRFGEAGDIADLGCVIDGLMSVLPESEIVPAERFWQMVIRQGEEVRLPALFEPPLSTRWRDLNAEFLIAAYHLELETSGDFTTYLVMSGYAAASRQIAAGLTVDVLNQTTLNAAEVSADEHDFYAHILMYPVIDAKSAASEPCEVIGELSGAAILAQGASKSPRVLVLAAGPNLYIAAQAVN